MAPAVRPPSKASDLDYNDFAEPTTTGTAGWSVDPMVGFGCVGGFGSLDFCFVRAMTTRISSDMGELAISKHYSFYLAYRITTESLQKRQ